MEKRRIIGCYNKSIILTFIGLLSTVIGMMYTDNLNIALICLVISGLCDLFDGKIARSIKRTSFEKLFGLQLDSLCDTFNFVAYPVILLYKICKDVVFTPLIILIVAAYSFAGIQRLGWYNSIELCEDAIKVESGYFMGLPVTYISLIMPIIYAMSYIFNMSYMLGFISAFVYMVISILFILNIKIKKPGKINSIILLSLAIVLIITLIIIGIQIEGTPGVK